MKKLILILLILVIGGLILNIKLRGQKNPNENIEKQNQILSQEKTEEVPQLTVIAEGLDTPWAIAFLPEGDMLVTERPGRIRYISREGNLSPEPLLTVLGVEEIGEGGLMGIALHPDFADNKYVYLYYTFRGEGNDTFNRVVRMKYENNKFGEEEIIVDNIPGNSNHNGGRIKFGPDKNLYITTGDAQEPSQAQDTNSLAGKILRVINGRVEVYSYGHRNSQGLAWDKDDRLWATEHGRSGVQSGLDELNLIEKGKNYGWPEIQGDETKRGMASPVANSGSDTWAPAGAAIINNSIYFGGLRGEALYRGEIKGNEVTVTELFKGEFGRIREVILGPDGMLYITTSNQDGRGSPRENDDKIIRINPEKILAKEIHYHAGFKLFVDGKQEDFSKAKYMSVSSCEVEESDHEENEQLEKAHLHDKVGDVVHVEAEGAKWKDLFMNINYEINDNRITGFVNGKKTANILEFSIRSYDSVIFFAGQEDLNLLDNAVTQERIIEAEKKTEEC